MLRLENVSKYYHSQNSVTLGLKQIDLTFEKGEFVAITGESGSGKSTLLNVLSGMISYEEGEMFVHGQKTSAYDSTDWEDYRRTKIGFIYQNYNLIDSYTALENVEAVMLINGQQIDNIEERAMEYLRLVGIEKRCHNRASQLSSGQKQRLSIARALAKGTDILVADEPTGNLDIEHGLQIMELLHQLSKDKLVIVVTHNYEQAKEFATRKIRLFDGEIAEDIRLRKHEPVKEQMAGVKLADKKVAEEKATEAKLADTKVTEEKTVGEKTSEAVTVDGKGAATGTEKTVLDADGKEMTHKPDLNQLTKEAGVTKEETRKEAWKRVLRFLMMNKKAQPHRNILMFLLLFCISFAFYVFLGGFFSNMDGAMGKSYSDAAYANGDNTRIVVRRVDNKEMTEKDRKKVSELKYVLDADLYDGVNDFNYYSIENTDYRLDFHTKERQEDMPDNMSVEFLDNTKYMRSATCLTKDDLKDGKLPSAKDEIVISAKDKGKVGDKITVYMANRKNWGEKQYVSFEMTVVGIAKDKTNQYYFDGDLCSTLYFSTLTEDAKAYYSLSGKGQSGFSGDSESGDIYPGITADELEEMMSLSQTQGKVVRSAMVFLLNPELDNETARVSDNFIDLAVTVDTNPLIISQCKVFPKTLIHYEDEEGIVVEDKVLNYDTENLTTHSQLVVEVGMETFTMLYGEDLATKQLSVYIKDYAYTDKVIKAINKLGEYEAISVYQVGAVAFDYDKVYEKLQSMCISLGACVVVFFLGIFIVYSIMKLKRDDFLILKSLGMRQKTVERINKLDLYGNMFITTILSIILCAILSAFNVEFIRTLFQYYRWYHYLMLIVVSVLMAGLIGKFFNKHIKKNTR